MTNILEIYKKYEIMPNLVEHQLRVAAVAMQICEHVSIEVDKESIVKACLLHDMGNIIKFKLDFFPDLLEPGTLSYWQDVQSRFIEKYGHDEHEATIEISKELSASEEVLNLINSVGFLQAKDTEANGDFNVKIVCYSDMRVKPSGIVPLDERLMDLRNRYEGRVEDRSVDYKNRPSTVNEEMRNIFEESLSKIEKQIFEKCSIRPEDINDESSAPYIDELKTFKLNI